MKKMRQEAPYPEALAELVVQVTHKPGWSFTLEDMERSEDGCSGLTLSILVMGPNSKGESAGAITVQHLFIVPAATYNRESWAHWLFERCLDVERHEAGEFFQLHVEQNGSVEHPFAPKHERGNDPYV